jgi:NADPH-dependent 2,4-dienoyl-CoA reductase/sulfur reductase-like enzyme
LYCYHIATNRSNVGCSVNPWYCNESFVSMELKPAETPKHIVVIGGGPAGINAALTASKRGHKVTLFEKNAWLGGALHFVIKEHYKEDIRLYLAYLLKQMEKSDVEVKLNTEATPKMLKALNPDVIFTAVGSVPVTPPIKGLDSKNVMGFYDALSDKEAIGQNVVIIGGGTIGAEMGLELAELHGKQVHIVEISDKIASQGNLLYRIALRQKMDVVDTLVRMTETMCTEISNEGVTVKGIDGKEQFLSADTVIICTGVAANKVVSESFYGITPDTFEIGDCLAPRKIMEAVFDGTTIASRI